MPDVFVSETKETPPVSTIESTETNSRLASFRLNPGDINFETKQKDEKVVLFMRAHPATNIKWILIAILLFFVPVAVKPFGIFNTLPMGFEIIITLFWYLVTTTYALENFLGWYSNVYFITNLRVIDMDFYSLIYKQVSDASVDKIQDVTYSTGGVARTFFNYGDVFIQTAAEVPQFDILSVPNPARVAKIIGDLITKDKQNE